MTATRSGARERSGAALFSGMLVALVVASGCVAAVPSITHGEHCGFSGQTACATCLKTSCQPAIDACCNDSSCSASDGHSAVLDALDACGNGDANGCASGLASATSGTAGAIRTCVTTTCKDTCVANVTVPVVAPPWDCNAAKTDDNACAACIYNNCSASIDTCCGDVSCERDQTFLDDVGRCVGGDAPGCAYLTTESKGGYAGVFRGCVAKSCGAACFGNGRLHESCSLEGSGSHCTCSDAAKASGPKCPGDLAGSGAACFLAAKGCECGRYSCQSSTSASGGCSCAFDGDPSVSSSGCSIDTSGSSSGGSTAGMCCIKLGDTSITCSCDPYTSECLSAIGEYATPSCDYADVQTQLVNAGRNVQSCSN